MPSLSAVVIRQKNIKKTTIYSYILLPTKTITDEQAKETNKHNKRSQKENKQTSEQSSPRPEITIAKLKQQEQEEEEQQK